MEGSYAVNRSRSATAISHEDRLAGLDVRINGPFNNMTPKEMEDKLRAFMEQTNIESIYQPVFRKGMYLAQYSESFADEEGRDDGLELTEPEKHFLKFDKLATTSDSYIWKSDRKKWNLPWPLWRLVTLCALGALVQGWDESAINSAQLFYQETLQFSLKDNPWKAGLVSSAPYLCCVFSCLLTQPLNAVFGRRGTIGLACICSAVFAILECFPGHSWRRMFLYRFLLGLGIGPKSATVPIYAAEAAPANVRGSLVMMWQVFTAFGIMAGYLTGVVFQNTGANNWKFMIGSPVVAPVILLLYLWTLPESPRWLVGKGHKARDNGNTKLAQARYQEAFESLMRLRNTKLQAARDMFLVYHLLDMEQIEIRKAERDPDKRWYQKGVFALVGARRNRRALFASLTCMFAQQFW